MPRKIEIKYCEDFPKPWLVDFAIVKTKFGDTQIGALKDAVVFLYFSSAETLKTNVDLLKKKWPELSFNENSISITKLSEKIFSNENNDTINVILNGTEFQNKVWKSLLELPSGHQISYSELAENCGHAPRAVANAVANNEIAYLIPCHRVVHKNPKTPSEYRWGAKIKQQIFNDEVENEK